MNPIEQLKSELKIVADIRGATSVLHWDQETYMPRGSGLARADQIAVLESLAHEHLVGPAVRDPLSELVDLDTSRLKQDLPEEEARLVEEIWRDYHLAAALPKAFVEEYAQTTARGQQVWAQARKENKFSDFVPHLKKIVELKYQEISYLGEKDTPYDTLLDQFEPGMTSAHITRLFDELKADLVPMVRAIARSGVDTHADLLHKTYDIDKQWAFGERVLKDMGFDFNCGRQDRSAHPFTTEFHPTDVRITTRLKPDDFLYCFSSTIHEGGHALYEQGLDPEWYGTPFAQAISYGIHESQSRMWENLVALSKPFWKHYYPLLQETFPENLGAVPLEHFYSAINTVTPSLIRTEADEMTYNLHVMLRYEVERMVINDHFPAEELPGLWNEKMEEYLGLRPPTDADGVLQDIHWSMGAFGYFPTYALGNLYNIIIYERVKQDIPDLEERISQGDLLVLLKWLREHVHRLGRRKKALELIESMSGGPLTSQPFLKYLKTKYQDLYPL